MSDEFDISLCDCLSGAPFRICRGEIGNDRVIATIRRQVMEARELRGDEREPAAMLANEGVMLGLDAVPLVAIGAPNTDRENQSLLPVSAGRGRRQNAAYLGKRGHQQNRDSHVKQTANKIRKTNSHASPQKAPTQKPAKQITTSQIPCMARGLVIRQDTSNLCGSRGKSIDIYSCSKFHECSLGRYCQHQTVRTCAACAMENQHVPPSESLPIIHADQPASIPTEPDKGISRLPADVTRHLTYHVWPVRERGTWQHNLDQLLRRIDLFNGRRIMGIVTGPGAEPAESVMDYVAGHGFEFVVEKNSRKLREVVTWLPMLELLEPHAREPGHVVFSAHAKGVRHAATIDNPETTIHRWATAMYDVLLDSWEDVRAKLDTHPFVGLFKRTNAFRTPGNNCWHYSGTFYWWRSDVIFRRNWKRVDRRFYGVESWPGLMATRDEAACLLVNEPGDLYLPQTWERIQKELNEWNRIHSAMS